MTELKFIHTKLGIVLLAVFTILIATIWAVLHFTGDAFLNNQIYFFGLIIAAGIVAFCFVKIFNKWFRKEYNIKISDKGLHIKTTNKEILHNWNDLFCIDVKGVNSEQINIFNPQNQSILKLQIPINSTKKGYHILQDLLDACLPHINLIKTNEVITRGTAPAYTAIYINEKYITRIDDAKKINKMQKKWAGIISFSVLALVCLLVYFSVKKDSKSYEIKNNQVYFDEKLIENCPANQFLDLGLGIAIDSNFVYQNGEKTQLDKKTFKNIEGGLYTDKNGIYKLNISFWSGNTIKPLEGNYDKATFQQLESGFLYKDKNHLYKLNYLAGADLKIVDIAGMDMATIQSIGFYFLADKNYIYTYTLKDEPIKIDKRFDRNTFVEIDNIVVKDKNHVYYNSKNLKYKDEKSTQNGTYKLLDGADAASFERVDYNSYKDKNGPWNILQEDEEVNFRK